MAVAQDERLSREGEYALNRTRLLVQTVRLESDEARVICSGRHNACRLMMRIVLKLLGHILPPISRD